MPQSNDPFDFTDTLTDIPGIGKEKSDPIYPTDEGAAAAHNLEDQPVIIGPPSKTYGTLSSLGDEYWDNVYMPQPKTREVIYPEYTNTAGNSGPGGAGTLGDDYRYWPAHRDADGGIVGNVYVVRMNSSGPGCLRYKSQDSSVNNGVSYSSDEGYWNTAVGSNWGHTGHYGLGSPAYNSIGDIDGGDNNLIDRAANNFAPVNYVSNFVQVFAPGYFTDCCTKVVIEANFLDAGADREWGTWAQGGNILYDVHYWDNDPSYYGCGYENNGANCCNKATQANICGRIHIKEDIADDSFVGAAPLPRIGGLTNGNEATADAGRRWLNYDAATHYEWTQGDIYETDEPSPAAHNPPGPFGVPDQRRTNRQYGVLKCQKTKIEGVNDPEDNIGAYDATEDCTKACYDNSTVTNRGWFVNRGYTWPIAHL